MGLNPKKALQVFTSLEKSRLTNFGFSFERGGAHTARTMMLLELNRLFEYLPDPETQKLEYKEAIESFNCLGKRSGKTRALTFRHLVDLYGLDPNIFLFKVFRYYWKRDVEARPLLAALFALCRDSIFSATGSFVLGITEGATVDRRVLESFLDEREPNRFSAATLKSTAQNINSSWTQAGLLTGRARKYRIKAMPSPGSIAFGLLIGYLRGFRGVELLSSEYILIQDCSYAKAIELAEDASRKGWLVFKRVDQIIEVQFPNLINQSVAELISEQSS